jgi:hypothetical protein
MDKNGQHLSQISFSDIGRRMDELRIMNPLAMGS